MNPAILSNIALKVVAVYIMAQGVMNIPSIVTLSQLDRNEQTFPLLIVAILSPLIVGMGIWLASNWLSSIIVRGLDEYSDNTSLSVSHVQAVAISTIGLILLVLSLPQLISIATHLLGNMDTINGENKFNLNMLSFFLATTLKIILGLSLVLGASGWVRLLYKVRGLGLK